MWLSMGGRSRRTWSEYLNTDFWQSGELYLACSRVYCLPFFDRPMKCLFSMSIFDQTPSQGSWHTVLMISDVACIAIRIDKQRSWEKGAFVYQPWSGKCPIHSMLQRFHYVVNLSRLAPCRTLRPQTSLDCVRCWTPFWTPGPRRTRKRRKWRRSIPTRPRHPSRRHRLP